ncbi:UDP-N-acetylmuramoyl-tripeptide--D-alanyl-D-alanine ligase [Microaerobacter geothermalis]|uniref:UDP-N-acetylmuramoyl-tripeptide--D-alanyl-D- alanine ligase n=1 Tax=Microaerobacter geothermalis TaxID=674972 RepID=UPI001F1C66DB|nr:UDP-N-acetylmuramoyl-tripeptide--D-alanyl-D-alanine ligase [Microaerobacter geothermalis]MCF6093092.1 UDP-N-acetylmuramoyl-tripeptide--D-alanyl-D-alanine ligase [Microaerobacter geothermalis]
MGKYAKILRTPIIAVTGSAGKTTTKEFIASILNKRWKIFKTRRNLNHFSHTAKYVKEINSSHRAIVLEYGMKRLGDIRKHCFSIQPNIGIITNVGTAHIGNFNGEITGIARAKSELIKHMNSRGILILNADDQQSKLLETDGFKGKILTVGIMNGDYIAKNIRYADHGMTFQVKLDGEDHHFFIPIYGQHNIYNALFAISVAHLLGFSPFEIKTGLRTFHKAKQRLVVYHYRKKIKIIDDTFSANPHAMKAAIDVLSQIGTGRNIAVLGSMLEMGKYSSKGHQEVGHYLANKRVDYLFTYGISARRIGDSAVKNGFPTHRVKHFTSKEQLQKYLLEKVIPHTTILVKGSHGLKMNYIVRYLSRRLKGKR